MTQTEFLEQGTTQDTIVKPEIEMYHDEHDKKGSDLYEKYIKNKNLTCLFQASQEFRLSSNPEGKKIADFAKAWYYREVGILEPDDKKASTLLLKSLTQMRKLGEKDDIAQAIELEYLKRKLGSLAKEGKEPELKLHLRRADLFKKRGQLKAYNQEMSIYYMRHVTSNADKMTDEEILKNTDLMLSHAKLGEGEELLHKTKGLYHQIRAKHIHNPKQSMKEFQLALDEVDKTSDKFAKDMIENDYNMAKAMTTYSLPKRQALLREAAKGYAKRGLNKHVSFIGTLLAPLSIRASGVVQNIELSVTRIRELEKFLVENRESNSSPSSLFYHISYLLTRTEDVKRIFLRMVDTRKKLTDLNIKSNAILPKRIKPGKPFSKKYQELSRQSGLLRGQMQQDMESLLIYSNLLLDQWSYIIGHIAGIDITKKISKNARELNSWGLLELLQHNYHGTLSNFWNKHSRDIIWLNFHIRFFRNIFIEHLRKPWQIGTTMGSYGVDFNFFIPAASGYVKKSEEQKILKEIYPLSPQRLRDMPNDYWEKKNLHRVLEITLHFIDEIESAEEREKVWKAWVKLGGSTQSYDVIAERLFRYLSSALGTVIELAKQNPQQIIYGKFGRKSIHTRK